MLYVQTFLYPFRLQPVGAFDTPPLPLRCSLPASSVGPALASPRCGRPAGPQPLPAQHLQPPERGAPCSSFPAARCPLRRSRSRGTPTRTEDGAPSSPTQPLLSVPPSFSTPGDSSLPDRLSALSLLHRRHRDPSFPHGASRSRHPPNPDTGPGSLPSSRLTYSLSCGHPPPHTSPFLPPLAWLCFRPQGPSLQETFLGVPPACVSRCHRRELRVGSHTAPYLLSPRPAESGVCSSLPLKP